MAYQAIVLEIVIASPGDVTAERTVAHEIIQEWNTAHSKARRIVLMPVAWDTHRAPKSGVGPQAVIGTGVAEKCDLLIGIFRARLGAPTAEALSNTVREIERHLRAGKPAMIYFLSRPPSPDLMDREQLDRLEALMATWQDRLLSADFSSTGDFGQKLGRHLAKTIDEDKYLARLVPSGGAGDSEVSNAAQPDSTPASLPPDLSAEAREILIEAAQDRGGLVRRFSTGNCGITLFVNRTSFGNEDDPETATTWQDALNQLVDNGLLQPQGSKGVEFKMTRRGYECAVVAGFPEEAGSTERS